VTDDPFPEPRDASEVGASAARAAWADAARPVLLAAAARYRATVTWKQLAAEVQESTGITTDAPVATWIGGVLGRVADECQSRDEPLLSSLCVSAQGTVGEQYADAVEHARGKHVADPDEHAAEERLSCYRHWEAAGLPRDGGTPLRTAHFKTTRKAPARTKPAARVPGAPRATATKATTTAATKKAASPAPEPKPVPLCPRCFTQVPSTGICDYCD
jgi:hypothetical protein